MPITQQSVCIFILLQGAIDLDEEQELNYRAICRAIIVAGYDAMSATSSGLKET